MATDSDTARSHYENYRFCYENGHELWATKARQCFEFWRGRQWDIQAAARLAREGRPALTFNVIESLVRSMKGIQRALRNDVRFAPFQHATSSDAQIMDAVWLHTQQATQLEFLETDVFEKALIMGRGYYDVRINYDDSFQGHVSIRTRRSQDIILDPSIDDYDPDQWPQVFDRRWVSNDDIKRMFGEDAAKEIGERGLPGWYEYEDEFMAQQMGDMPYYHYSEVTDTRNIRGHLLLGRQYFTTKRKDVFVDVQTGDISEIPETWDRNRVSEILRATPGLNTVRRDVKTVRWTVASENTVLHDEDSPYKHFTIVPFFPTFVDGVTMGVVESLLDPQQLFNKITSQELHIINTTANSGWKVKAGALRNMTENQLEERGSKSGFVAVLDDIQHMEKIQPNSTPQGHDRLSFKADQIMRSLGGVPDGGRGFARDDASGEKVLQDQAGQDINFAGWLSNLHRSKQLLASRVRDCVQAHYTETRVIQINRGSALNPDIQSITLNEPTPEGQMLNDVTRGRYTTTLVPAPSRTTMSEGDFKLMLELRKLGIAVPDAMLIELSPAANKAQILQLMQGDSNERAREAEEAQAQIAQAEMQKVAAQAEKDQSAAALNNARAQKFAVETQSDPDAAYERVETARIESDNAAQARKEQFEREKFEHQKQFDARELAFKLTQLDAKKEADKAKAAADAKKPKATPPKAKKK